MSDAAKPEAQARAKIGAALARIPQGLFILTARYEDRRAGTLVSWVQQVSFEPPMVCMAVAKGRAIMPLISDSHVFALCQIGAKEKLLLKKFAGKQSSDDPFVGFELVPNTVTGVPVPKVSLAYMECQMTTHMDIEGDHDLFIAKVVGGDYFGGDPAVHLREDGFKY